MTALRRLVFLIACLTAPFPVLANDLMQDTFDSSPETRWRFFADTVMGGVSRGQATFHRDNGVAYARLSGQVSTANNGGFIQMRRDDIDPSKGATGVRLIARGNTQTYYIHLRTGGTLLPWQYYQAAFDVTPQWRESACRSWISNPQAVSSAARPAPKA